MPIARVFIIEDEAITALDIRKTLEKLNYEIVGIKDRGEDALKVIEKANPDIILMDISLKGELDGIETARLLNIQKRLPIVYLTAHYDDETIERSKSTNPYGFLLKPLNDRDLNSCIRMALYRFESENNLKEVEDQLTVSKRSAETLFNSIQNTAFIINSKGIITSVNNKSAEEKFPASHFINSDIRKVFPGRTGNKFSLLIEATLQKGTENSFEHIIKVEENKFRYETSFFKYSDTEVLAVFNNITSGREVEQALRGSEIKYRNLIKNSPLAITRLLIKSNQYEFVNDEFIKQSGYTLEEFNALTNDEYFNMIHPDDRVEVIKEYTDWIKNGSKGLKNLVYRIRNKNDEMIWLDSYHYADILPDGTIEAVNQIYLNINRQKQSEEILVESKQCLDAFFQQSMDGIFIAKMDIPVKWDKGKGSDKQLENIMKNVRIVRANIPLAVQFGLTPHQVLNQTAESYYGSKSADAKKRWKTFLDKGFSHIKEYFTKADGSSIYIEGDYYCLYDSKKNFTGYLGIQRDMTDRKNSEDLLKLSEEKFRAVAESMPAQVVIFQDEKFVYANPYSEMITGYKTQEILKKNFWELVHEDYRDLAKERGEKRLRGEIVPDNYEMQIITKNKDTKWLNYSARLIQYNGKKAVLGIATDITESKRNQEKIRLSEEKYRNFVEHSSEGIFRLEFKKPIPTDIAADEQVELIKKNVFIAECNSVFARMYDEDKPEKIIGKNISKLKYQNPDFNSRILKFVTHEYSAVEDETIEYDGTGREKFFVVNISGVIDGGMLTNIWGVQRDISEKKRSEEALKRSLIEKDILLKEIHHRVKNNLQIVTSLLKLQAGYVKDEKIKQLFRESQNRVQSMSLIHQKLYQSRDLAHIDFNMIMSIDNAIPAGLIVNELVSNSLKHAFPEGSHGNIYINAAYDEYNKEYWLLIRDDGIGMKVKPDIENSGSFGLKLVHTLVKQLEGIMEIVTSGGSEFRIHFRSADYKERNS
jgi:PAS domain S-box-containing protein